MKSLKNKEINKMIIEKKILNCIYCNKEFIKNQKVHKYCSNNCKYKEYHSRPEVKKHMKEYKKEYNSRPEVKKYMKEYHSRPEVKKHMKEYMKEYHSRPEVKKHMKEYKKEYNSRPEVKKHMKEYNSRPEVKKHRKERYYSKYTADDILNQFLKDIIKNE